MSVDHKTDERLQSKMTAGHACSIHTTVNNLTGWQRLSVIQDRWVARCVTRPLSALSVRPVPFTEHGSAAGGEPGAAGWSSAARTLGEEHVTDRIVASMRRRRQMTRQRRKNAQDIKMWCHQGKACRVHLRCTGLSGVDL